MGIKIRVSEPSEKPPFSYPFIGCLKDVPGLKILFIRESEGVVIDPGSTSWRLGNDYDEWNMDVVEKYLGEITLSND